MALCAIALLLCSLAPARAHDGHGDANDPLTCKTVKCQGGLVCIIAEDGTPDCVPPPVCTQGCDTGTVCRFVEGQPTCIPEWTNPCIYTTCLTGKVCVAKPGDDAAECVSPCSIKTCPANKKCTVLPSGKARCIGASVNPCALTTCLTGQICVAEDDTAKCISACSTVRCGEGKKCIIKENGRAKCVGASVTPCAYTTCRRGTICMAEPGDETAKCITACATVKCSSGKKCVVTKMGKAKCVKETVNPCAFTTCLAGTICVPEPDGLSAKCLDKCATVKCATGRRCVVNRRGNAVCRKTTRLF